MSHLTLFVILSTLCLIISAAAVCQEEFINLALNPSFEEDEVILDDPDWFQWATWGDADGLRSTVEIDRTEFIDGARSLKINPKGVENWHFIVLNLPMDVNLGGTYTASLWAKSTESRPLGVQFKATDNTVSWGYADFELTTEWSEYYLISESLSNQLKLELFCAASEAPIWLDFVNVYEGNYVEGIMPSEMITPVEPAGKLAVRWAELRK